MSEPALEGNSAWSRLARLHSPTPLTPRLNLRRNISRGFLTQNVNDFSSVGLSGLGFAVSPEGRHRLRGYRLGEPSSLAAIPENSLDTNYRTIGSGIDGPGPQSRDPHWFNS